MAIVEEDLEQLRATVSISDVVQQHIVFQHQCKTRVAGEEAAHDLHMRQVTSQLPQHRRHAVFAPVGRLVECGALFHDAHALVLYREKVYGPRTFGKEAAAAVTAAVN